MEEFSALQAMNRIRHAYLEMVPSLERYFSTSHYDDVASVLSTYGARRARARSPTSSHGLTTMPGMIGVLDAALAGAVAAAIATAAGAGDARRVRRRHRRRTWRDARAHRVFGPRVRQRRRARFVARFPAPDAAGRAISPGRRNT